MHMHLAPAVRRFPQQARRGALWHQASVGEGARILRLAAEDASSDRSRTSAQRFELGVQADRLAQGWFNAALLAGELGFFATATSRNYLNCCRMRRRASRATDDLWNTKPAIARRDQ